MTFFKSHSKQFLGFALILAVLRHVLMPSLLCFSQKLVAYLKYMTTVGVLLGGRDRNETERQMRDVLEFEMKLAKVCI